MFYIIILISIIILALIIILKKDSLLRKFLITVVSLAILTGVILLLIVVGVENSTQRKHKNVLIEDNKNTHSVLIDKYNLDEEAKKIKIDFNYFIKDIAYSMITPQDNGPVVINARVFNYSKVVVNSLSVQYHLEDCNNQTCIIIDEGVIKVRQDIPLNQARDIKFSIGRKDMSVYGTLKVSLTIEKINQ